MTEKVKYLHRIGGGRPTMRGIIVSVLHGRFVAGETIPEMAEDYGLSVEEVEIAIRHQCRVFAMLEPATVEDKKEKVKEKANAAAD